jgi:excisionase family DNA binding protein
MTDENRDKPSKRKQTRPGGAPAAVEKFYLVDEAAEATRTPVKTFRDWILKEKVKVVRPGRRVLVPESEVHRLLGIAK